MNFSYLKWWQDDISMVMGMATAWMTMETWHGDGHVSYLGPLVRLGVWKGLDFGISTNFRGWIVRKIGNRIFIWYNNIEIPNI